MATKNDLLPGTLEVLILRTLSIEPMHGYGIALHIERLSREVLQVEEGSLYPALQRLELKGWVRSQWRVTPTKRRARYYQLTRTGDRQLGLELQSFDRLFAAIRRVLRPSGAA